MKREHRNVGSRISSHNICLKDVRCKLPIGCVARKISDISLDVRLECRTRAVKICKAALRHPWIHSPHFSDDGDLRWSCSNCGKKMQSIDGCFPIHRGRNPCSSSDLPPVMEERARIVRDLDSCYLETLFLRNSVLRWRSWLGATGLKLVGVVRRRLTGLVQTVDGVFLRSLQEHGCWRNSMLGLMVRCCKRRKHLFVIIFGNKGVKLLQRIRVSSVRPCGTKAGQNVHIS